MAGQQKAGSCRLLRHPRLDRLHQCEPARWSESGVSVNLHPAPPWLGRQNHKPLGGPGYLSGAHNVCGRSTSAWRLCRTEPLMTVIAARPCSHPDRPLTWTPRPLYRPCCGGDGFLVQTVVAAPADAISGVDLATYKRIGRHDLPEPTRTAAPARPRWPSPRPHRGAVAAAPTPPTGGS